jgi:hypothetical protein
MARVAWVARQNRRRRGERGKNHQGEEILGQFRFHVSTLGFAGLTFHFL